MDFNEASISSNPSFSHNELIVSAEIAYGIGATVDDEVGSANCVGEDAVERKAVEREVVERETIERETVEREAVESGEIERGVVATVGMGSGVDTLPSNVFGRSELGATGSSVLDEQVAVAVAIVVVTIVVMSVCVSSRTEMVIGIETSGVIEDGIMRRLGFCVKSRATNKQHHHNRFASHDHRGC